MTFIMLKHDICQLERFLDFLYIDILHVAKFTISRTKVNRNTTIG